MRKAFGRGQCHTGPAGALCMQTEGTSRCHQPAQHTEPTACLPTNALNYHRCSFQGLPVFTFQRSNIHKRPTNICKRLLQLQVSPASQAPVHPFTLPLCRSFLSPAGLFCPTAVSHLHPVFEKVWKKMGDTSTSFDFLVIVTQQPQFELENLFTYVTTHKSFTCEVTFWSFCSIFSGKEKV